MKNLRIIILMMAMLFVFSCASSEDDEGQGDTLLNTPVAGTIYGDAFAISATGGYASNITANGVESVNIYLTAQNLGCNAPDGTEFPVSVLAPRAVGIHTTDVSVTFKDPNSTDYITTTNLTVEIISVGSTVVGRVMGSSISVANSINGKFEVPYCQ